jgi:hypothetical protein
MGHVRFKINDQVVTAEVIEQQSSTSRNTGKELFQVEVRFQVHEDQKDFCTEALRNQNATLLSPEGDSSKDIPVRVHEKQHSFTMGDPIQRCTWVLSEFEELNLEALQIGDVTVNPYKYSDEFSEDALVCNFCIDVDATMYKYVRSLPKYFPVVRKGVSDAPRTMRLGEVVWATEDEQTYRLRATLVEQSYDKPGAGNGIMQPAFGNVMDVLSVTTIRISRILDMLESKGLLTDEEKKTIREVAEEEWKERRCQFLRVKDFDKWIENEN